MRGKVKNVVASTSRPIAAGVAADFYRRAPKQKRSSEKVQRILDSAAQLLEEVPFEEVTARLIAERAGITIPTFYGYFKDRDAVFATLGLRYVEEASEIIDAFTADGSFETWEDAVDASIDRYVTWFRERVGFRALWFGGHVDNSVLEADRRGNDYIAAKLRSLLASIAGAKADAVPLEVYRFSVEMSDRMIGYGFEEDPRGDPRIFAELKVAARAYLGTYLNSGPRRRSRAR